MLFRRLDVDGSGTISLEDLKAAVLDDAPSSWFSHPRGEGESTGKSKLRSLRVAAKFSRGAAAADSGDAAPAAEVSTGAASTEPSENSKSKGAKKNGAAKMKKSVNKLVVGAVLKGGASGSSKVQPHPDK
jgi:hypothetical protein